MDLMGQFLGQNAIHRTLTRDPVLAGERGGDDGDAKMGFAAGTRAGMAGMAGRLVDDLEPDRGETLGQAGTQPVDRGHGETVRAAQTLVNCRETMGGARLPTLVLPGGASHTVSMSRSMLNMRFDANRFGFDDDAPPPLARACDHPGCAGAGEYRAPRSRETLNEYYWFCLDHVRSYNASWNYYAGMNEAQIEAELRKDLVGHRPSWKFGHRVAWRFGNGVKDFGLFDFDEETVGARPRSRPLTPQEKALATFDLALPLNLAVLKRRYKELVKQHHPDANGGDKAAEERLKIINQAYATLKASYFPS